MASVTYFSVVVLIVCYLSACAPYPSQEQTFRETRVDLAISLEQQSRYADALLQWQSLYLVFPEDEYVARQLSKIEETIEQKLSGLREQLDHSGNNDTKNRLLYLKMLALQPDNLQALENLRGLEQNLANQLAKKQTEKIKRAYLAKRPQVTAAATTNQYLEEATRLYQQGNDEELLKLTDKLLAQASGHNQALEYRFKVLIKMAKNAIGSQQPEKAVEFFESALSIPGIAGDELSEVEKSHQQLRRELSVLYYRRGMKYFNTEIDQAVNYLRISVEYDSENFKAYQQLERAAKIQKNLKLINRAG